MYSIETHETKESGRKKYRSALRIEILSIMHTQRDDRRARRAISNERTALGFNVH